MKNMGNISDSASTHMRAREMRDFFRFNVKSLLLFKAEEISREIRRKANGGGKVMEA